MFLIDVVLEQILRNQILLIYLALVLSTLDISMPKALRFYPLEFIQYVVRTKNALNAEKVYLAINVVS